MWSEIGLFTEKGVYRHRMNIVKKMSQHWVRSIMRNHYKQTILLMAIWLISYIWTKNRSMPFIYPQGFWLDSWPSRLHEFKQQVKLFNWYFFTALLWLIEFIYTLNWKHPYSASDNNEINNRFARFKFIKKFRMQKIM